MNRLRRGLLTSVMAMGCFLLTGCTILYSFDFSGTVTNATSGNPVQGVTIHLLRERLYNLSQTDPDWPWPGLVHDAVTDQNGKFSFVKRISAGQFGPDDTSIQFLVFSKNGFQNKAVKLVLKAVPKETVSVIVNVKLLPATKSKKR